jgi:FkbM family methyltransferase
MYTSIPAFGNAVWHKKTPPQSARSLLQRTHRAILSGIRRLPARREAAFRIYNRALRSIRPQYTGTTFFGAKVNCSLDDLIQSYIFHFSVWEPEISNLIVQNLAPGDVFIDVGANIGYDSLLGSWRVGPSGKVVAIEASPKAFGQLQANIELNAFAAKNVRAVQVAASDRQGVLELYDLFAGNMGAATTIAGRGGTRIASVEAKPLVDILTPDEINTVRLIKIDVEGAEPAIMDNILESLSRFPKTMDLLVEMSPGERPQRIFDRMKAEGFYAYRVRNDYSRERYISAGPIAAIVPTDKLPDVQCDVFYTRRCLHPAA